ncbi:DegT/DnrJ/EryC1/StrS aminotransferase family protein [Chromobacterium sp. IIBBL 290-4]|uniref:DegT/DnrJ/EryC1/StrS family aminotransferase n=1 Tax=Chromobacterium sp. IIBBL 290-4 TaxID=2953890 RepID=UPI0020B8F2B2|nr:DegT/DnrJ/EryC1/StrS family aminotransferase [Chromobacterium sp. IIBBL 290-4]UTH74299.1 DegT/DnrJ/EryC1/StrS family aminotransferase [Chromobacterium sp. IIBBL 290-4]
MTDIAIAAPSALRTISDKYRASGPNDLAQLQRALSGPLSGFSPMVAEYEDALAEWFDARAAVAVSSGGAALSAALFAAGVERGDDVLLTPSCPLCTVFPIIEAGANPIFVDTRPHGFGADPASIAERLTARSRAIIDIPMWGYPTEVDELRGFADASGLRLILDLAHSHGSTLRGQPLSRYGHLSCFSTHERKPLATGEGGFILSDNEELARRCRSYIDFGHLTGRDFGLNYKLSALAAALGLSRLPRLADQITQRRANARRLLKRLSHPRVKEKTIIAGGEPNYYFLNLQLDFADNRAFIDYLDRRGIPSDIKRYGCKALYRFPALAPYQRPCPQAEALLASMTTLPAHPGLSEADLDYMADCVNGYDGD